MGHDRGPEMGPDDDHLIVDQVIDRPDRGHRTLGEHDPAQRHAGQQLPGLRRGQFQCLPGPHDLLPGLLISRHNPSPMTS